jgi:hypothetical protein
MTSLEAVEKMRLGKIVRHNFYMYRMRYDGMIVDASQEKFCWDPEDFAGSGISQDWEIVGE